MFGGQNFADDPRELAKTEFRLGTAIAVERLRAADPDIV